MGCYNVARVAVPLVPPETRERDPPTTAGGAPIRLGADEGRPDEPTKDMIFEVLRASRRREVLRYLDAHDGEASVGKLAEHVAAGENETEPTMVSSTQRKRAYVALYQVHLPKLADYGVVDYERARGHVRLLPPSWWYIEYLYFEPGEDPFQEDDSTGSPISRLVRWLRHE